MVRSRGSVWKGTLEFPSKEVSSNIRTLTLPPLSYPRTPEILKLSSRGACVLSTTPWGGFKPWRAAWIMRVSFAWVWLEEGEDWISLLEYEVVLLCFETQRKIYSRWTTVPLPFRTELFTVWGREVKEPLPLVKQWILLKEVLILIVLPFNSSWKQQGSCKSNSQNWFACFD